MNNTGELCENLCCCYANIVPALMRKMKSSCDGEKSVAVSMGRSVIAVDWPYQLFDILFEIGFEFVSHIFHSFIALI